MLKRDSLTAQMQQLSQVLAKVKRLIIEDLEEDAKNISYDVFKEYFRLDNIDLLQLDENDFLEKTISKNLKAEEINMLAYFVDEYAGLQDELSSQLLLYRKYLTLIQLLEDKYQFASLDHISRRGILKEQLANLSTNR